MKKAPLLSLWTPLLCALDGRDATPAHDAADCDVLIVGPEHPGAACAPFVVGDLDDEPAMWNGLAHQAAHLGQQPVPKERDRAAPL